MKRSTRISIAILLCITMISSGLFSSVAAFAETGVAGDPPSSGEAQSPADSDSKTKLLTYGISYFKGSELEKSEMVKQHVPVDSGIDMTVEEEIPIPADKYEGYVFDEVKTGEVPQKGDTIESGTEIKIYYTKKEDVKEPEENTDSDMKVLSYGIAYLQGDKMADYEMVKKEVPKDETTNKIQVESDIPAPADKFEGYKLDQEKTGDLPKKGDIIESGTELKVVYTKTEESEGELENPGEAPAVQVSTDIKDYLDKVEIETYNGKPYDPANSVDPNGNFKFKVTFSEKPNVKQFPLDGKMTYQIPQDQITGFKAVANAEIWENGDKENGRRFGTYEISESGLVTVDLEDEFVKYYSNLTVFIAFEGSFKVTEGSGSEITEITFGEDVSLKVKLDTKPTLQKEAVGEYNFEENSLEYKLTIKTTSDAKKLVLTDTATTGAIGAVPANQFLLKENSVNVVDGNGRVVDFDLEPNGGNSNVWTLNFKGEIIPANTTYIVTYKMGFSGAAWEAMKADKTTAFSHDVFNTASVTADDKDPVTATSTKKIQIHRIGKAVAIDGNLLKWTITVNNNKQLNLNGFTLKDEMKEGLTVDTAKKMQITKNDVMEQVGWDTGNPVQVNNGWTYEFLNDAGKSTYTFVYWTNKPVGEGTSATYNNTATLSKENLSYGVTTGYTTQKPTVMKYKASGEKPVIDHNGDKYIHWKTEITVPEGTHKLYLKDAIDQKALQQSFLKPLEVVKGNGTPGRFDEIAVQGYNGNVKLSLAEDGKSFEMYFGGETKDSSEINRTDVTGSGGKITMLYYTKTSNQAGHYKNNAWIFSPDNKQIFYDWEDFWIKSIEGSKEGVYDQETKTILWTITINKNNADLQTNQLTVTDTFSDNQEYDHGYTATLKQQNGTNVGFKSAIVDGNKVTFETNTLPKPEDRYLLQYRTKVKDDAFAKANGDNVKFFNTAVVSSGGKQLMEMRKDLEVSGKAITKKQTVAPTDKNSYKAEFAIQVNPNKLILVPGGTDTGDYTITDTFSENLELDISSIKVMQGGKVLVKGEDKDYTLGVQGQEFVLKIPKADGKEYTITYAATVRGTVGAEANYSNTAKLDASAFTEGTGVTDKVMISEQSSSGGATASELNINLYKYDTGATEPLSGAKFDLYENNTNEASLLGTVTTDAEGKVTLGQKGGNTNLKKALVPGTKYILIETQAPSGYEKSDKEYIFQIIGKGSDNLTDITNNYAYGGTIQIANTKLNGTFEVTKTVLQDGKENPSEDTFKIGIFKDPDFKTLASDINNKDAVMSIAMDGQTSATAVSAKMPIGTYYVAEVDENNMALTTSSKLEIKVTVGGEATSEIEVTADSNKDVEITNNYKTPVQSVKVTKVVKKDGKDSTSNGVYYVGLFQDEQHTKLAKDVSGRDLLRTIAMNGQSNKTIEITNVPIGTYYVAETDKNGKALTDRNNEIGSVITYDNQVIQVGDNNLIGGATITNSYFTETPTPTPPTPTDPPVLPSPMGSIKVTKDVMQDGAALATYNTYYTALFRDSSFTNRISDVKALEMKGLESTAITFDNLPLNTTYYVAETDQSGVALPSQNNLIGADITYENQVTTLDANHLSAESKITNSYASEYYWAGSIDVTKRVTVGGKDTETEYIFYAGLYTDKECTQQVGDIQPLMMNGNATATVTFEDLPLDTTYYVAETDAKGNVIIDAKEQLGCELTINNGEITITKENQTGAAELVNNYSDEEQFYYDGQIIVKKKTTYNGDAYKTDDVFYVALFADKAHKEIVSDVQALEMNGKSAAEVSFENLAYGTYYLAETDENGKALTDLEAGDRGFTGVVEETVEVDAEPVELELENQMTEEYVNNGGNNGGNDSGNTGTNTGGSNSNTTGNNNDNGSQSSNNIGSTTQTGDNTDIAVILLCMMMALTIMAIMAVNRKQQQNK